MPQLQESNLNSDTQDFGTASSDTPDTPLFLASASGSSHHQSFNNNTKDTQQQQQDSATSSSRRMSILTMLAATTATTTAMLPVLPASAGKPEMDKFGNLFSPKADMLTGGSEAARGISTRKRGKRLQPGEALQSVYETRFIAYLSRFLLNYDPAVNAWWNQNSPTLDTWDSVDNNNENSNNDNNNNNNNNQNTLDPNLVNQFRFAEFAESVEVGLADYFVGPYGSYSSVQAAKAGILATAPALSSQPTKNQNIATLLQDIFSNNKNSAASSARSDSSRTNNKQQKAGTTGTTMPAKQGILNLYSLLKARYTSVSAKRQLAILFSFISQPSLQPTLAIRGLLGEADNATISKLQLIRPSVADESKSRTSSRRGGGYSISDPPRVVVEAPPALGDDYRPAQCTAILRPTTRILRIKVTDPGEGYFGAEPPLVTVESSPLLTKPCQACAIMDREGHVAEVLVLDPGYGFGGRQSRRGQQQPRPPKVTIQRPKVGVKKKQQFSIEDGDDDKDIQPRIAKAVAELEYEVVDVQMDHGGNGFVKTEAPNVHITPPTEDPDWFLATQEQPEMRMVPVPEIEPLRVQVIEMKNAEGTVVYRDSNDDATDDDGGASATAIDNALVQRLQREPLELLPSSVLLESSSSPKPLDGNNANKQLYKVASLPPIPSNTKVPSPRYRAFDPIFGGVGSVPVTKGARALSASEYARLSLSGAVCTVLVRTALNPLELIKTKQQLENDPELFDYARKRLMRQRGDNDDDNEKTTDTKRQHGDGSAPRVATRSASGKGTNTVTSGPIAATTTATAVLEPSVDTTTALSDDKELAKLGLTDLIFSLAELRGPFAPFQSADITFLASLVFGSFGFGATELFRRSFTEIFYNDAGGGSGGGSEVVLLLAAGLATVVTSAAATPFEVLRVKSMIRLDSVGWTEVLQTFLRENEKQAAKTAAKRVQRNEGGDSSGLEDINPKDLLPLWSGFAPTLSRELPFAIAKFLAFDVLARLITDVINSQTQEGALPVQVGVGPAGLAVSAIAGAVAGVAGAIVSHPADLILTYTSASKAQDDDDESGAEALNTSTPAWVSVVRDLLSRDGGIANLFLGLPARATFFFLVIGLQFFLYDYVKNLFQVGTDDLSLVLDVFYAVRAGLLDMD